MSQPFYTLSLVTAPTDEPVSIAEAKRQCRIDDDVHDEDDLIASLVTAAREHAETYTNRALLSQTWSMKLDRFPCDGESIWIPKPPLQSTGFSVSYVDQNGDSQTWSSSLYQLARPSGPKAQHARLQPAYNQYYPITRTQPEAVTIQFVCGWSSAPDVPEGIKQGIKLLVSHWYGTGRDVVATGTIVTEIPHTVDALLMPYLVKRW